MQSETTPNPNGNTSLDLVSMTTANLRQRQIGCIERILNLPSQNKVLIFDSSTRDILSPLFDTSDLCVYGINQCYPIDQEKGRIPSPNSPAIYFVKPTQHNIQRIISEASNRLYKTLHFCFPSQVPRHLLGYLVKSSSIHVHDKQYVEFVTLKDNFFSLLADTKPCYVQLNDPKATRPEIELVIDKIVTGLFCLLSTLNVVPIITCPRGGPAEMVASLLDQRLRDEYSLFSTETSSERPVLCLFDRNFELSVAIQHDFRYGPLVHDVLGLRGNRLSSVQGKSLILRGHDTFWTNHGSIEFPSIADKLDALRENYKHDLQKNCKPVSTDFSSIIDAIDALPELADREQVIITHTHIQNALRGEITERSLDYFAEKECEMMLRSGDGVRFGDLLGAILRGNGNKMDKLRFAIMFLLSDENITREQVEEVGSALNEAEVDTNAFWFVERLKSSTISVKKRDHRSAVAGTVKALMEGTLNDSDYLMFDSKSNSAASLNLEGGRPFKEAIVFTIGGGNYVEYEYLQELAKHIIYGSTEILTGCEFVDQLTLLGQKTGVHR